MTHSAVFKRSALLEVGGHDPSLGPSADSVLFHALAVRHGVCFIPEPLALWRRVDESPEALRRGADFEASLLACEVVEAGLRALRVPEDYLRVWKTKALYAMVYETDRRNPGRFDQLAELCRRLPAPSLVDRAFLWGLRSGLGRWRLLTKLYLFSRHPWRDQLRIVRQRLFR